jgi:hypothetical protein
MKFIFNGLPNVISILYSLKLEVASGTQVCDSVKNVIQV